MGRCLHMPDNSWDSLTRRLRRSSPSWTVALNLKSIDDETLERRIVNGRISTFEAGGNTSEEIQSEIIGGIMPNGSR